MLHIISMYEQLYVHMNKLSAFALQPSFPL